MPPRVPRDAEQWTIKFANSLDGRELKAPALANEAAKVWGASAPSERYIRERLGRWRDKSTWTLATDTTGQPAVVLRVLATLQRVSERQIDKIGQDDARWVVRLAEALPRLTSAKPLPPELINPFGEPAVTLYLLAQIFRVADNANDSAELARLTAEVAAAYAERED